MKKFVLGSLALGCIVVFSSANTNGSNAAKPSSGVWTVALFTQRGNNETSDYNGYTFDFISNGTFTVTTNGQSTTGAWLQKLVISVTSTDHRIAKLADDWILVNSTGTALDLPDNPA